MGKTRGKPDAGGGEGAAKGYSLEDQQGSEQRTGASPTCHRRRRQGLQRVGLLCTL